jgi:uncharacterized protein YprB with RNaseH-like and TPR domain
VVEVAGRELLASWREDVSPMSRTIFEGLNRPPSLDLPYVGFDIETYSPNGFPEDGEDPVVTATLAMSISRDPRRGMLLISLIYPPSLEENLLAWLHRFLSSSKGGLLLTYNGARFDLQYATHRGRIYGIDFETAFSSYEHVDVYEVVRRANIQLPSYGQKTVERFMGVNRLVNDVSGSSYHQVFHNFLRSGSLKPLFYNIEDSVGCLRIVDAVFRRLKPVSFLLNER